ncbi:adenosyl-hopene transferase HpnH [Acidisphaera sp. L21]|jgi:hopanoid biosynthesis associated radical SAM protein HpnH|uniref:adenosyl-hopene transferase HpnH n=1 Tax=Acidisphaera sp. L21 TaxID=1641851 RepID=UPI00131BB8C8|nr:adenosyl-hopene transferase HpnH [Acidisphaera sp. L21]
MSIPVQQVLRVGAYVVKQHLTGRKRYPLVLMLEPLFRCNLACSGCGKIDYPNEILNQRLSVADALEAVDECGAPVVAIAGGEPLLHREMPEIVAKILERKKFVYLCTNALLLEKKMDDYKPNPFFSWDVHLDGDKEMHDKAVSQDGVYERAISAIKKAKERGFRLSINCTLFDGAQADRVAKFFDDVMAMGIDGIMTSPGYAYERAPDQAHFLSRQKTKQLFRDILTRGKGKGWKFTQSPLFMNFLAGNESYHCTPWGKPTRNVFGWQRPCYLLGEGYAKTYTELMETTDWDKYGTGNYEKCADCMVHSGYESTAVVDAVKSPIKTMMVALRGPRTTGPMAPEIPLDKQRPAEYTFSKHVQQKMEQIRHKPKAAEMSDAD